MWNSVPVSQKVAQPPSLGEIILARENLKDTRLHVIIRPRGGDFLYSDLELQRMLIDIDVCRREGVDGVVFGCLTPEGEIDMEKNKLLLSHAKNMSVTFHRAFDHCSDPFDSLHRLSVLGFHRVLTSGQQPTAMIGVHLLKKLNLASEGKIEVMAGCGINEKNIQYIYKETGIREYHFSAREPIPTQMKFRNPTVYMGDVDADESYILQTTESRVRSVINALEDSK